MQIGMVGVGKTGFHMGLRLHQKGHDVVGYDRAPESRERFAAAGMTSTETIADLVDALAAPRITCLMLPPGNPTNEAIAELSGFLSTGDLVIDGGHSSFREAPVVAARLGEKGIGFIDLGLSGGVWALDQGYCLMVGGGDDAVGRAEPLLRDLAADGGYAHLGPVGAGHFAKTVHHGVEVGLMRAYEEAFAHLEGAPAFTYNLGEVDRIWAHSSLAYSCSLEITKDSLQPGDDTSEAERRARVIALHDRFVADLG